MSEQTTSSRPQIIGQKGKAWSRSGDVLQKASVAIGCVALFLVFSALTKTFYQPSNLIDIMLQSSINAVIAVGMTLVIMTKGIDLSVGSIVGLSSMVAAHLLSHGLLAGIGAGLVVGLICGAINGVLIAKLRLPDFIVTLGTLSVYRGAALIYTDGQPIYGLSKEFRAIFAGRVLEIPDAGDPGAGYRGACVSPGAVHRARRADHCRRRKRRGSQALGRQHRARQDNGLYRFRACFRA